MLLLPNCKIMSKMYMAVLFVALNFVCFSQNSKFISDDTKPKNIELYNVFYEIKDFELTNDNYSVFQGFDVLSYENLRQPELDVEIYIQAIDKTIILYSAQKAIIKRDEEILKNMPKNN